MTSSPAARIVTAQASPAGPAPIMMASRVGVTKSLPRRRATMEKRLLPPDLVGDFDREAELGPLLFLGQDVAFLGRGKAALRRHRELVKRREFGGLFETALDVVLLLELAEFRGNDADHDHLVALRQIAQ